MVELEEAIELLKEAVTPVKETETIPLMEASGRILAEDLTAPMDQPPFPRSPLDGYAVRGLDTTGASKEKPVTLKVLGKIYAGQVFPGEAGQGECVRLMTGAPIPQGADTVIRQEDTDYGEDVVQIYRSSLPWQNYCYEGEDYKKGDVLVRAGTKINGALTGIIAGTGHDQVRVLRRPVITVISTGDEVVSPGSPLTPGKIYDSNRFLVAGRLSELGRVRIESSHCEDDASAMCKRIREAAADSDLIITTGGVSVGEKDIMHQVLEDLEGRRLFWTVRVKPGAPTLAFTIRKSALGQAGTDHKSPGEREDEELLVICLTGNPYGVAVNFELLVRPVLEKVTGDSGWACRVRTCILENDSPKRGGIRRLMRGRLSRGSSSDTASSGGHRVRILDGSQASGTLSTLAECNCFVEIPEDGDGKAGDRVRVYPL